MGFPGSLEAWVLSQVEAVVGSPLSTVAWPVTRAAVQALAVEVMFAAAETEPAVKVAGVGESVATPINAYVEAAMDDQRGQ